MGMFKIRRCIDNVQLLPKLVFPIVLKLNVFHHLHRKEISAEMVCLNCLLSNYQLSIKRRAWLCISSNVAHTCRICIKRKVYVQLAPNPLFHGYPSNCYIGRVCCYNASLQAQKTYPCQVSNHSHYRKTCNGISACGVVPKFQSVRSNFRWNALFITINKPPKM